MIIFEPLNVILLKLKPDRTKIRIHVIHKKTTRLITIEFNNTPSMNNTTTQQR